MGFRINTNVQSMTAQRYLGNTNSHVQKSQERLSAGRRIVRSADDSAGLAISENMRAQIRSMRQAKRNAQDGVSLIQTAEGGMNEISNILVRMRELSVQAATDTVGQNERAFIDKEIMQLRSEVDRIAASTEFNGKKLLTGTDGLVELQVGTQNDPLGDRIGIDLEKIATNLEQLGITDITVASKEDAQNNLDTVDLAIQRLSESRSEMGALQNRLETSIRNLEIYDENLSAAKSRIFDADVAHEATELTKNNILAQAGTAVLSQANQNSLKALELL